MRAADGDLMAYIDAEVRAACEAKGWRHQIRRKWSVRATPVSESPIDDYEWKLIPNAQMGRPDPTADDFEGVYYLLRYDSPGGRFVLQHDTSHFGMLGPQWEVATYTEIRRKPWLADATGREHDTAPGDLDAGWLRDHLLRLITQFEPNFFSRT